jgi:hypothetical protein
VLAIRLGFFVKFYATAGAEADAADACSAGEGLRENCGNALPS